MNYPLLAEHRNLELEKAPSSGEMTLAGISELHKRLGFPERTFPVVHITGTKGKGSTAAMLASILQSAGLRVGIYASPHIISLEERIRLNGQFIKQERLHAILEEKLRPCCETMESEGFVLTFFELLTLAAFLFFAEEKVDFALIEVGMGGRNDATNICSPCLSILTNISLDHTAQLGTTLEEIAFQKAGIIKPRIPVLIGTMPSATQSRVFPVIHTIALEKDAPEAWAGRDFPAQTEPELTLGMPGEHQRENAALALKAVELLNPMFPAPIPKNVILDGLRNAKLPGRLEIVSKNPVIILDAAHTPESMEQAVQWIQKRFPKIIKKRIVFAAAGDKNWKKMLEMLLCLRPELIFLTEFPQERSASAQEMAAFLNHVSSDHSCSIQSEDCQSGDFHPCVRVVSSPVAAVRAAREQLNPEDLILVTGSFFLLREIYKLF